MPNTVLLVGDALGVLDVQTFPINGYDAASTYKATMGGKTISVLGSGGTTTTVATALAAALAASLIPEFKEFTWTSSTNNVIATANESTAVGKTHAITTAVSGGTGTIGAPTSTTTPKGSEALTAENCKLTTGTRSLPVNGDTFFVAQLDGNLRFGLDALAAITTLTVYFQANFTGECGLPFSNADSTAYNEYRQRYFQTNGGTFVVGAGEGNGSGRIMIDALGSAATFLILKTASTEDDDQYACVIKGTNANNALKAVSGTVDVAPHAGELATLLTVTVTGDASVRTSKGTTLGDVIVDQQAKIEIDAAASLTDITSITVHGSGQVLITGANDITALTLNGQQPKIDFRPSANIVLPTVNAYAGSIIDLDNSPSQVTFTTFNPFGKVTINDRQGKLIFTNAVPRFLSLVTYNGPPGRPITLGAP